MSLRSRLGAWIAGERATTPAQDFTPFGSQFFGVGIGNQPDHAALLRESRGIPATATRKIVERLSSLNPLVKTTRQVMAGTTEDEILDDHELKRLLDRPHPNLSWRQLMWLTTHWLITVGEGYWLKVGNGFRVPGELHPAPPSSLSPIISRNVVQGYVLQDSNGRRSELPPDAVVRFFLPDPENLWGAEGFLGPQGVVADARKFASEHLRSHYQHDATPPTALEAQDNATAFSDSELERFNNVWRQRYHKRSGTNVGVPAILPTHYKLIQLAMQTGSELTPLLEHWQNELLSSFGVPRSILGQVVSGDRSSAETNQFVFDLHTVLPLAKMIEDTLTFQLAPDFADDIFVEFEEFVSEDKDFKLRKRDSDLANKVSSINMVRQDEGLDPVPWGEEPVGAFTDAPYRPDEDFSDPEPTGGGSVAVDDADEGEEPDEEAPRRRSHQRVTDAELELILASIREQPMRDVLVEELRALFETLGQAALSEIGADQVFEMADPRVTEYLERHAARKVRQITRTTREAVREQLLEGTAQGEGIGSLSNRIGNVFNAARGARARVIARTETVGAATTATEAGFEQGGAEGKEWLSSKDEAVREAHQILDGTVVALGAQFTSPTTGAQGDGPGLFGSAEDDIRCRCALIPVLTQADRSSLKEQARSQYWRVRETRRQPFERRVMRAVRKSLRVQEREAKAALRESRPEQQAA